LNILITGASGFVGKATCKAFLKNKNFNLTSVSRKRSSFSKEIKQIIIKEINKETNWEKIIENCDIVIHLASIAHVSKYNNARMKKQYSRINYEGTINLFKAAINNKVKKFIFLSSIKVNGDYNINCKSFKYDDLPNPTNIYSKLKLKTEIELIKLAQNKSIDVIILRPSLIYGKHVKGNLLSLYKWVYKGYPFLISKEDVNKSFLSIDNLLDVLLKCINTNNIKNEVLLVSDPVPITLKVLLEKISEYQNRKPKFISMNKRIIFFIFYSLGLKNIYSSLYLDSTVDIQRTIQLLNWKPQENIDQSIKNSVDFFLNNK